MIIVKNIILQICFLKYPIILRDGTNIILYKKYDCPL